MSKKTGIVIQARMGSTRLPGKSLNLLLGKPLISHIIERVSTCSLPDIVILATSTAPQDTVLAETVLGIPVFRGSEQDVLDRYFQTAETYELDYIVRVTGDNPLVDPGHIDTLISRLRQETADFASPSGLPLGCGAEVFTRQALVTAHKQAHAPYQREHVTPYMKEHGDIFPAIIVPCDIPPGSSSIRLTVDTPEDFLFMEKIYRRLYTGSPVSVRAVLELLAGEPELLTINQHIQQKKYHE